MSKINLTTERNILEKACSSLRAFTLGQRGVSERAGAKDIEKVQAQCDRLNRLFGAGPDAKKIAMIVASARTRILAAQARLALLAKSKVSALA